MEELELIERYFRKELKPDESARFSERLATDPEFKRKFETEKLLHRALQFSREKERVKLYSVAHAPAAAPALSLDGRALLKLGATALAVWILSTFSSSVTSLSPENIKWVGLTVSIVVSLAILTWNQKPETWNLKLGTLSLFHGLLVFVLASGFDSINQGMKGIADKSTNEAHIVPFTEDKAWWPTHSLEDSLDANRKQMVELRNRIRDLVSTRLSAGLSLNFGVATMRYGVVVVPRSSTVASGATYEADLYLAASPLQQKMEMQLNGNPIPMEADASGVMKGKVSFTASADKFDSRGQARKTFVTEIKLGDSSYRRVVEYVILKR